MVQRLLFICAHWHGLAKLRIHSDLTLDVLDEVTTSLGTGFRHFQDRICPAYNSKELPRETDARHRRRQKEASRQRRPNAHVKKKAKLDRDAPRKKKFNLQTYKHHSLGDYVKTIRQLGTSDSFSTTTVRIIRCDHTL